MAEIVRHVRTGVLYEVLFRGAQVRTSLPLSDYATVMVVARPGAPVSVRPAHWIVSGHDVLFESAQIQTSKPLQGGAEVVVYRSKADGRIWVRPIAEMDDGRFEVIAKAGTPEPSSASAPIQILYAENGGPATVRTILLPVPRAEMVAGPGGRRFAALDVEAGEHRWFEMSGLRAWGEENVAGALPGEGEVEGLRKKAAAANDKLQSLYFNSDRGSVARLTALAGIEAITALLAVVRSSGGGEKNRGTSSSMNGLSQVEPASGLNPSGFDPSRMFALAGATAKAIMRGPAETCTNRKEFLEGTIPLIEEALQSMIQTAPEIETEGQNPKGSGAKHESPIAGSEAPASIVQVSSPTPARQKEGSRGEATYQGRSAAWMGIAFADDPTDGPERRDRTAEEDCEAYQSDGGTLDDWIAIGRYVFSRPAGSLPKEIGQKLFTMACWAAHNGIDMMAEAERELARCSTTEFIETLARKRATRHGRGPLPGFSGPETSALGIAPTPDANSGGEATGRDAWCYDMDLAPRDQTHVLLTIPNQMGGSRDHVGEARFEPEVHGGTWWWAGETEGDYYAEPIHALPVAWRHLPDPAAPHPSQDTGGDDA